MSSAAAALKNGFKKRYKRAVKRWLQQSQIFGCSGKPFDSNKQCCFSGAENS